ncbi:hypothetical protein AB5I41_03735 [Sphingomonas sp. MMS24-JH45]
MAALTGGTDDDNGLPDESDQGQTAPAASALGVNVQPLTPVIARQVGVNSSIQGVVVVQTDPSSDAAQKLASRR